MSKILGAALLAAALAVAAYGQAPIPNDRIVGCYLGTWANYRFVSANLNYQVTCDQSNLHIQENQIRGPLATALYDPLAIVERLSSWHDSDLLRASIVRLLGPT